MANTQQSNRPAPAGAQPPRRRLAPNVVCAFNDDRAPVVNRMRRGPLPRNVVSFAPTPREFTAGDVCMLARDLGATESNAGRVVRLVQPFRTEHSTQWIVEAFTEPLTLLDRSTTLPTGERGVMAYVWQDVLRWLPQSPAREWAAARTRSEEKTRAKLRALCAQHDALRATLNHLAPEGYAQ